MKGQVLDFSIQTNSGIISGEDQNRYQFSGVEWRDQKPPARGDSVDFSHDNAGNALQIYRALQPSNSFSSLNNQLDKISNLNQSEENYNIVDWTVKVLMCAEKTGGFNLVNYRHSSGVYHEQETEDLHRRI